MYGKADFSLQPSNNHNLYCPVSSRSFRQHILCFLCAWSRDWEKKQWEKKQKKQKQANKKQLKNQRKKWKQQKVIVLTILFQIFTHNRTLKAMLCSVLAIVSSLCMILCFLTVTLLLLWGFVSDETKLVCEHQCT